MAALNPYLNFNGNAEEAFNLYRSVFGGEFLTLMRFKDAPEGDKISDDDQDKIMHISLPIGKGNVLMGSDALESMGQKVIVGNNNYISIDVDTREEADKFFNGLSDGGKVEMAMEETFWGSYFGSFADKFGVCWMVSYELEKEKV
ncbi:MAG: VOC family protein [Balneolales bacterium]